MHCCVARLSPCVDAVVALYGAASRDTALASWALSSSAGRARIPRTACPTTVNGLSTDCQRTVYGLSGLSTVCLSTCMSGCSVVEACTQSYMACLTRRATAAHWYTAHGLALHSPCLLLFQVRLPSAINEARGLRAPRQESCPRFS